MINNRAWGYLRSFSLGIIVKNKQLAVSIPQKDIEYCEFFNVIDVTNNSTEAISVWLDGNSLRSIYIKAGSAKSINGSRFRTLVAYNENAVADTSADEVKVTIQKELGNTEIRALRAQGVLL